MTCPFHPKGESVNENSGKQQKKKRIFKLNLALFFFYKNTGSYYVAMTDLKLTMQISQP